MKVRDWVLHHPRIVGMFFPGLAVLNIWSGYTLLDKHPIMGWGNLATAAALVWLVILTWSGTEAG